MTLPPAFGPDFNLHTYNAHTHIWIQPSLWWEGRLRENRPPTVWCLKRTEASQNALCLLKDLLRLGFYFFLVKSNTHCPSLACNSNLLREDVIRHFHQNEEKQYFFFRNIKQTAFCQHIISPVWTTLWICINANVTTINENLDFIH